MPPFPHLVVAASLLVGGPALAQQPKPPDMPLATNAARRFPQPVVVGTLIDRRVLQPLESQPTLGRVRQIVRRADGSLDAVVAYGGLAGFGARPIAVPVDAMVLLGEYMEIVDFTPAQLDGFPTFDGAGATPLKPEEVIRVGLARPSH